MQKIGFQTHLLSLAVIFLANALVFGCGDDEPGPTDAGPDTATDVPTEVDYGPVPPVIGGVPPNNLVEIGGLSGPAHVVYTESHVPHVYAENRLDAVRVLGYVMARDRFFFMDLARRLSAGTVSEIFGADALETDIESRGSGMRFVAEQMQARWTDEQNQMVEAYVAGINEYIEAVKNRDEFGPSEYIFAANLFGFSGPGEMMADFDAFSIAAVAASLTYELGYETGDIRRGQAAQMIDDLYTGEALAELRTLGAWDAFSRVTSSNGFTSAGGWELETNALRPRTPPAGFRPRPVADSMRLEAGVLERMLARADRLDERFGHDQDGFGSNAWAISGTQTTDGAAILASDGHLPGTVPSFFYRFGMDTTLLGDGDTRQVGLGLPGLPLMAVGTNGNVAWSQTQLFGDITDWYRDELVLDADGAPMGTVVGAGTMPLQKIDEVYNVAEIEALESEAAMPTISRYATFDGRLITSIEGRVLTGDDMPAAGETEVNVMGDRIVPADMDGDDVITALSFDYAGLEGPNFWLSLDAWGHASTVQDMYDSAGYLVAYSQNIVAADSAGSVLYLPYQVVPCRDHLPRNADRTWMAGADPRQLIDGTRFGGFELPLSADGKVDETGPTPSRCSVPQAAYPAALNPADGRVVNSNNDPGTMTVDNDLTNDPHYIGGPWPEDYRATRIDGLIGESLGDIDEDASAATQGDIHSPLGELFVPLILEAIDSARSLAGGGELEPLTSDARQAALFTANEADLDNFEARLMAWRDGGFLSNSGIETFYNTPTEATRKNAVATTLFNVWFGHFNQLALDDEHFPSGTFSPTGSGGKMRVMTRMIRGRGPGNTLGAVDYNPETEESVFFDVLGTDEVETSNEIMVSSIVSALVWLRGEPEGRGRGGFGNDDWDTWLWGYRHYFTLDSVLGEILGGGDFASLAAAYSITPDQLPLMDDLPSGDPRRDIPGFPRPGDNFAVDAASSGFGLDFTFNSVAVMRMVIAPRGDQTTGRNMIPGGQSGMTRSDYFSDQAAAWLANETTPMHLTAEQVAGGGTEREVFVPRP